MTKKIFSAILLLILVTGCSLTSATGNEISGPTVEPTVHASGTVLFQDSFDNAASGWDHTNDFSGIMDYDNGTYRIQVNMGNTNMWATPSKTFSDTRIEVDVVKIGGPETRGEPRCHLLQRACQIRHRHPVREVPDPLVEPADVGHVPGVHAVVTAADAPA